MEANEQTAFLHGVGRTGGTPDVGGMRRGETQSPSSGQGGDTPVSWISEGEEIILAYPWSLNSPDSSPAAERHYQYVQELNAKYHVTITEKSINGSYYNNNMVTTVLSGKPMGHIMIGYDQFAADYYKAGIFAELNDAMAKTGIDFKNDAIYNQLVTRFCNFNGKQVGFSNSVEVQKTSGSSICGCFGRRVSTFTAWWTGANGPGTRRKNWGNA